MKKKIVCFILALCLLVPSAFILSGCSDFGQEYAWGKTFTYQGVIDARYRMNAYSAETAPQVLLETELAKGNLDLKNIRIYGDITRYGKEKEILNATKGKIITSVDDLKEVLNARVKALMNAQLKNFSIKIGTKEESTITLSNSTKTTKYSLVQGKMNENGDNRVFIGDLYGFYLGNPNLGKAKYMGGISSVLPKSISGFELNQKCLDVGLETSEEDSDYMYGNYLTPIKIVIPTITRVYGGGGYYPTRDELNNIYSNVRIDFIPYLSVVE